MSRGSPARSWSCCASSPSPAKRDRVSNGRKLFPVSPAGPRTCRAGLREQGGPVRTGMLRLEGAAGLAGRAGRESHLSASASWQSKRASGRERARRHGCWHGTHGTGGSGARKPTGESAGGRDQGAVARPFHLASPAHRAHVPVWFFGQATALHKHWLAPSSSSSRAPCAGCGCQAGGSPGCGQGCPAARAALSSRVPSSPG